MGTELATLRPLSMGELFDRAIRLYRRNFLKFIGVIAAIQIPLTGLTMVVNWFTADAGLSALSDPSAFTPGQNPFELFGPEYYIGVLASLFVALASLVLISGVASAALTRSAADSYLGQGSQSASPIDAYRSVGDRWGPLVGAIFLYIIVAILLFIWTIIPCVGWITGPGMLVVAAGMVLPLLAPIVVLERRSPAQSLRRAWELVRRRFWWIFGFMLLLTLFTWVVVSGPSLVVGLVIGFILPEQMAGGDLQTMNTIQVVTQSLVSLVVSVLYLPLQLSCLTVLYFDLRVRLEGLDLVLTPGTGLNDPENVRQKIAESAPPIGGPLVTGREFLNFSGISLLLVAFYVVIFIGLGAVLVALGSV